VSELDPDERALLDALRAERPYFRAALDPHVLSWVLDDSGFWFVDAGLIVPARIAFCNRLMSKMGIVTPGKQTSLRLAQALIGAATDEDLKEIEEKSDGRPVT
jgi:hypothetical protein